MDSNHPRQIQFKSYDDLDITADYYKINNSKGFILLCHRSHFNRGEYKDIAPILNNLGYSCLAIDQRSGMNVLGFINETSSLAKKKKLPTGYLDAKPDIEAAVDYAFKENNKKPIIILGSSYSASLALIVGTESDRIKAVIAFSPGEYLKKTNVTEIVREINIPIYVTSTKKEIQDVSNLIRNVNPKYVTHFKPEIEGEHGARVLWSKSVNSATYWKSLEKFLEKI